MADKFTVDFSWELLLRDLGILPGDLLRQARLPLDLFSHASPKLTSEEYFRLWDSLETLLDDPFVPLRLVQSFSVEAFSPPLFAAFCSPDLMTALNRLSIYKPLICPMMLDIVADDQGVSARFHSLDGTPIPASFAANELVFLTWLARTALRDDNVRPLEVELIDPPQEIRAYRAYFGTTPRKGRQNAIRFSRHDALRPFLSVNDGMFEIFEPELRSRLDALRGNQSFAVRVRACLVESLAAGRSSMGDVAATLAVSTRTLQRRLKDEGTSFQQVLADLRSELAHSYLRHSRLSSAEISFLLGYDDPNSFIRAFHAWTGMSPEVARARLN